MKEHFPAPQRVGLPAHVLILEPNRYLLAGISLPDFFWGIVLILLFSRGLNLLPSSDIVWANI